jgi:hypothetical protein
MYFRLPVFANITLESSFTYLERYRKGNGKVTYNNVVNLFEMILTRRYIPSSTMLIYTCIPIATLVIIGNSLAPPHVKLMMMTFSKPINAIVLIIGGYMLQVALIYTSIRSILNLRSKRLTATA